MAVMDVGNNVCAGPEPTFLARAKESLTSFLQRKIFARNCHDIVGTVLFGTSGTDNPLATDGDFQHVKVVRELVGVDWEAIEQVQALRCGGSSGDWLDAMAVALEMLRKHDPHSGLKLEKRKIVLFTDFSGEFSKSRYKEVEQELKDSETRLVVIGPEFSEDFDEEDQNEHQPGSSNGGEGHSKPPKTQPLNWNGKAKTVVQMAGEALATEMAALCDGLVCSFDNAMAQLMYFEKSNKTTACWNTTLDIGAAFKIPITGRIMVQQAPIPSWKKFYRDDRTQVISKEGSYHLMDERQTEVPEEEVISGYLYGTTLVPCSNEDMSRMYCSNSPRSMSVTGFTEASRVRHHLRTGNQVLAVMARGGDEPAARALSALIHALAELDMVAITRRVYSKNYNPKMGALFPEVTKDGECLLWIQLPYSMEVVSLAFPSLQSRMAKLKEEEKDAVDSLIDAMTLSQAGEDEDDENEEEFDPRELLDPRLQHYYNILTQRALNPGQQGIQEPAPHILEILQPPERVREAQGQVAEDLKKLFPLKAASSVAKRARNVFQVEDKAEDGGEKRAKVDDSLSPGDLVQHRVTCVTSATPVHDFMTLLRREAPDFDDICKQMGKVALALLNGLLCPLSAGMADNTMEKLLQCLKAFRQESRSINPATYNSFLPDLKELVTQHSQNAVWEKLKEGSLGLITSEESVRSSVGTEEAAAFLRLGQEAAAAAVGDMPDDMHDMLDDL